MMMDWETKMQSPINEGVEHNGLRDLVKTQISIDQYKSKVGKDENIIVVAFSVLDKDPAGDLSQFLETGVDAYDVDVSNGPDEEGYYSVFLEIDRNSKAWDTVSDIVKQVKNLDNNFEDVTFVSYENKTPQPLTQENFENSVIISSYDYVMKHNPDAKEINERIKFLKDY